MMFPADWDRPDVNNDLLCKQFKKGKYSEKDDMYLLYRYFVPKDAVSSDPDTFPLAVYLHGADAFGSDNISQLSIHDIGTMFSTEGWQREHPCYILAPQCDKMHHWSRPSMLQLLQDTVLNFVAEHPEIDKDRIYVYGYSAGGLGTLNLIKRYPGFYAAAVPICGATGGERLEMLLSTPVWLVHAADDGIVRYSYRYKLDERDKGREGYYLGSKDIYERLKKMWPFDDGRINYTEYPEGWMKEKFDVNPHCSWVTVSDETYGKPVRDWLFSQKRSTQPRKYLFV